MQRNRDKIDKKKQYVINTGPLETVKCRMFCSKATELMRYNTHS